MRGAIMGQTERAEHDYSMAAARVQLGGEVVAAWLVGPAMPSEQVLAEVVALVRHMRAMRHSKIGD